MDELNEQVKKSLIVMLGRFEKEELNSIDAANVIKETAELYKALSVYETECHRLELDKQIAEDKRSVDIATIKNEKKTFWIGVCDIASRLALGTSSTMFNAAIFQQLLNAEKDTLVGNSTSMKTFLRGGFKIFKNNM